MKKVIVNAFILCVSLILFSCVTKNNYLNEFSFEFQDGDSTSNVKNNITFKEKSNDGKATFIVTSSSPSVITNDGIVVRQDVNVTVTITVHYSITEGKISKENIKTDFVVTKRDEFQNVYYFFNDNIVQTVSVVKGDVLQDTFTYNLGANFELLGFYFDSQFKNNVDLQTYIVTTDINIYVKANDLSEPPVVKYTYLIHYLNVVETIELVEGAKLTDVFEFPDIDGYRYKDAYTDSDYSIKYNLVSAASKDRNIYLKYVGLYSLTIINSSFNFNYEIEVEEGQTVSNVFEIPEVEKYIFAGYFLNESCTDSYQASSSITSDLTLYLKFTQNKFNVDIYYSNGAADEHLLVLISTPVDSIVKKSFSGFVYKGLFSDSEMIIPLVDTVVGNNLTIYVKFEESTIVYEPYYQALEGIYNVSTFRSTLKSIITPSPAQSSYEQAKVTLQFSDADPNNPNNLLTVYSRTSVKGLWTSGGTIWNREHVFPNSKVGYQNGGAAEHDTHNLRPAKADENGSRGNMSYGEGTGEFKVVTIDGTKYFWPGDYDKGDVARIIMYMAIRYDLNPVGNNGAFYSIALLLKWNIEDPVDDFERHRNDVIQQYQKNRNPFVDHPEFANILFGSAQLDYQYNNQINIYSSNYVFVYQPIIADIISLREMKKSINI